MRRATTLLHRQPLTHSIRSYNSFSNVGPDIAGAITCLNNKIIHRQHTLPPPYSKSFVFNCNWAHTHTYTYIYTRGIHNRSGRYHNVSSTASTPIPGTRTMTNINRNVRMGIAQSASGDGGVDTTIYALSTPPGKSAIGVVRVSGPACLDIYRSLCPGKQLPKPRHATLRVLYEPQNPNQKQEVLDPGALVLYFPAPRSTTGEDILELHLHGGPAILRSVLNAIPTCPTPLSKSSIRYAEPGEFTRRAFLNDRLSLPQIEALGDTLSATTEQQRKLSLRGSGMNLTSLYENWRRQLVEARGELEALIDFSEDQSLEVPPPKILSGVTRGVKKLKVQMTTFVENAVRGELLRDGISISLVGAPNVGKSSLLNRIVGREAVIVSREAGTTRDVVDLSVDLGGYVMIVGDTAGLRIGDVGGDAENVVGEIEKEGIRRARRRMMEGDVVVVILGIEKDEVSGSVGLLIPQEVIEVVKDAMGAEKPKEVVVAVNKLDLLRDSADFENADEKNLPPIPDSFLQQIRETFPSLPGHAIVGICCYNSAALTPSSTSALSNTQESSSSIQPLLHALTELFGRMTSPGSSSSSSMNDSEAEDSLAATTRQRLLVESCLQYLDRYLSMTRLEERGYISEAVDGDDVYVVLAAEELRSAAECLSRITGRGEGAGGTGDVEEVLGVVFERFCVGK